MNDQMPDTTALIAILTTIFLVFILIFTQRPHNSQLEPTIQWKDQPSNQINSEIIY